jgi:DNA-binding CsgD family transcriptional regulator
MKNSQNDVRGVLDNEELERLEKRVEEQKEKLEFLQNIAHSLPAIVYLFDIQELKMIWCNERHKELIGFDTTGMQLVNEQGKLRAISNEDQTMAMENIKDWRNKELPPSGVVIRLTDVNGTPHFFITEHSVFKKDEANNPEWILGTGIDISSPIETEQEKRLLYSEDINKTQQLLEIMSDRELEVLERLSDGKSYGTIATDMNLSVDGIRYHIRNIYKKLNVHTRAEAIKKGLKYRLFNP